MKSNQINIEIANVVNRGFCIGCGACTIISPSIEVYLNQHGEYIADLERASSTELQNASSVCPFSNTTDNESVIADAIFKDVCTNYDDRVGYYSNLYAGYSGDYRRFGSSGGIVTWLLASLLMNNIIDKVIRVGPSSNGNIYFGYEVITDPLSLVTGSTSFYYPVTMQDVLSYVKENPGRYAITAVPCFHKALRLLKKADPIILDRITYQIGIVCGQMKSSFYLEYLLRRIKMNGDLVSACFRRKDINARADQYLFEAKYKTKLSDKFVTATLSNDQIGANWGMGLFKPKACDFCDDVFAETADIAVMDGWLPKYIEDGNGMSLVLSRNNLLNQLLFNLTTDNNSYLEPITVEEIIHSQQGGLNHRRKGLRYRLYLSRNQLWYPHKRVSISNTQGMIFRIDQRIRLLLRTQSRLSFYVQKVYGRGLFIYNISMFIPLFLYKVVTRVKRIMNRFITLAHTDGSDGLD